MIYFDSAATYLKPNAVIEAVCDCYLNYAGTIGRGVHLMAEEASARFSDARETIANFINADAEEIIFVRSATEAINFVAVSLKEGSQICGSIGEHHSNLLPWRVRHNFQSLKMDSFGAIDLDALSATLTGNPPALIACSSIGNALGRCIRSSSWCTLDMRWGPKCSSI